MAKFLNQILVVEQQVINSDKKYRTLYENLDDLPEDSGEVAIYELKEKKKLVIMRALK
jgi:hypothetical protein